MTDKEEAAYMNGRRAAWAAMLHEVFRQLGYDDPSVRQTAWLAEREEAIAMLRQVCADHGDNDWEDDLHLADIVEKHLYNHLEQEE